MRLLNDMPSGDDSPADFVVSSLTLLFWAAVILVVFWLFISLVASL